MLNKKYLPSLGFIILVMTVVSSGLFIKWAIGPLSYERAKLEEKLGHQLAKEGKNIEAAKHFLKAAEIETDNISRSRQYRCVGSTSTSLEDKIKYFKLSLKYNPNNGNALLGLKNLYKNGFVYIDRWGDGWSKGKTGKIQIIATKDAKYRLMYSTSSPEKKDFEVIVYLNNKILEKKKIQSGKPNTLKISLSEGNHEILIFINHTFNPKKLRMSDDDRELGIRFIVKKLG